MRFLFCQIMFYFCCCCMFCCLLSILMNDYVISILYPKATLLLFCVRAVHKRCRGHFADKGEEGSIFHDFVRTFLWTTPKFIVVGITTF